MKKLMLSAAALMIGAIGFAQVTDTDGDLSPSPNVVAPLPNAAAGANTGESVQNGNDNRVWVRQAGTSQSVYTNQSDGSGIGGNLAKVMQTGAVSAASGVANAADTRQQGTENQSNTIQEGDANEAVTRQGMNDDGSTGNKARIRQGTGQQAQDNFAAIDQDGDGNLASTRQTYDNSDAWTQQVGDENKSMIVQNASPNQSDGHYASVEQQGDLNESFVDQRGNGARNSAYLLQVGDENQSKQYQIATDGKGGTGNDALVVQGDGTVGTNLIGSIWIGQLLPIDNIANGSFNPGSDRAAAFQRQEGAGNDAEAHQFGEDNYSEQRQTGDNNDAFVVQNAYGNPNGNSNYAKQLQVGNDNQAGIGQNGTGHKAYQRQYDNNNIAMSTQRGQDNLVNTYQDGDFNHATTGQRGQDNQILLVQRGGHSYSVTQNLPNGTPVGMPNGGNVADILQLGPNGDFANDGIDCTFDPEMDLDMDYSIPDISIDDVCPGC
ncbi:curlin [Marixanthomonas spongiae]|uniref:Curlin n=1 Tax=Marixanthomonas spongiae TaxID=2174845 RepID=A0A2U0I073_9FLAO|nr:curlin [Marixanthomonas spongiae]PVW14512.1 curlin [Marixanthomonas spongiae]